MGRSEGFAEYAAARWPRLVRSAILLGCTPHEAEDIVQTTLEKCLRHWDRTVSRAVNVDAYVHRVLINTFISSRRRPWRHEQTTADPPEPPQSGAAAADADLVDAFARALRELNADQRAAIVLRYYSDLSEQQTADSLGVPVGTVKSRVARGLKALAGNTHLLNLEEPR